LSSIDVSSVTLKILDNWRRFLLAVRGNITEEDEGLANFIDIIETLPEAALEDSPDAELASGLRLVIQLNALMLIGLEEPEHHIVLDAHGKAMMRLANVMRNRGHRCTLPQVKLY
jgi:hypothetical protein